eukprot:UN23668
MIVYQKQLGNNVRISHFKKYIVVEARLRKSQVTALHMSPDSSVKLSSRKYGDIIRVKGQVGYIQVHDGTKQKVPEGIPDIFYHFSQVKGQPVGKNMTVEFSIVSGANRASEAVNVMLQNSQETAPYSTINTNSPPIISPASTTSLSYFKPTSPTSSTKQKYPEFDSNDYWESSIAARKSKESLDRPN